eukprot:CAMPEP_0195262244 /NCGR_PEP_ID=MMETSP0706-20130129/9645_1 /TAXON_ID=33640 /ORGANISM="Asterionellopsis glacialis, Strain CCMP134" /LENGTH=166 /DNA_ID=CAMNT_0040316299 /DNA_START=60 /DNA_END=560 /DNA_ORIENTATION=+
MNSSQFFFIALSLMVQMAQSFSTPTFLFLSTQKKNILNDRSFLDDCDGVSRRNPPVLFATKKPSTKTISTAAPSSTSLYYRDGIEDEEADILAQSVAMTSTTSAIPDIEIPRHVQENKIESNNDSVNLMDSLEISFGRVAMIVAFVLFSSELQTGLSISEQFQNLL